MSVFFPFCDMGAREEVDETAILFAGDSGTGKSTLATVLQSRVYKVLSDDICAVHSFSGSPPVLYPGLPELKLWSDVAEAGKGKGVKPSGVASFFRKGEIGAWREQLSEQQMQKIIADHGEIMGRFGYLDQDGSPAC